MELSYESLFVFMFSLLHVFMWSCLSEYRHEACGPQSQDNSGAILHLPLFKTGLLSLSCSPYSRLARELPGSRLSFHLSEGELVVQVHSSVPSFMWGLGAQTQVLCLPAGTLSTELSPSLPFVFFKFLHMLCI